jgi:hypothetical protein
MTCQRTLDKLLRMGAYRSPPREWLQKGYLGAPR